MSTKSTDQLIIFFTTNALQTSMGPCHPHGLILISAFIDKHIGYNVWNELFVHSQISTVQPLSFGMDR